MSRLDDVDDARIELPDRSGPSLRGDRLEYNRLLRRFYAHEKLFDEVEREGTEIQLKRRLENGQMVGILGTAATMLGAIPMAFMRLATAVM